MISFGLFCLHEILCGITLMILDLKRGRILKRELRLHWLLLGSLICSTGGSLLWPLTTIYMHDYLHQSLTVAGTVLFFNSITLIIGSWLGGYIYDHGKVRFFLILSVLMQAASVFC